jgi:hypothetical protein
LQEIFWESKGHRGEEAKKSNSEGVPDGEKRTEKYVYISISILLLFSLWLDPCKSNIVYLGNIKMARRARERRNHWRRERRNHWRKQMKFVRTRINYLSEYFAF